MLTGRSLTGLISLRPYVNPLSRTRPDTHTHLRLDLKSGLPAESEKRLAKEQVFRTRFMPATEQSQKLREWVATQLPLLHVNFWIFPHPQREWNVIICKLLTHPVKLCILKKYVYHRFLFEILFRAFWREYSLFFVVPMPQSSIVEISFVFSSSIFNSYNLFLDPRVFIWSCMQFPFF